MRLIALAGIVTGLTFGVAGSAGAVVLYEQVPSGTFTSPVVPSHDHSNDMFDSSGTDDFSIGDGQVWVVQGVEAIGAAITNGTHTASVSIFVDAGGVPGGQIFSQSGLSIPDCSGSMATPGDCNLSLTIAGPSLAPGAYWLLIQTGGESVWTWQLHTPEETFGHPALWQNPGDGWGSGCTAYAQVINCGWSDASDGKDFVFALTGTLIDSRFSLDRLSARRLRLFATVNVPAAGSMKVGGKGVKKATKQLAAGEQRLRVKLKGGVLDRLRSGRNAKVRVKLTFTATGGDAYVAAAKAKLVPIGRAGTFRVAP